MTSVTFVLSDKDKDGENFTFDSAENWAEYILDETGIKGFCDRILVNNKEVWKLGDKTLKDVLFSNSEPKGSTHNTD
jgi:hypothetical protein